MKKVLLPVFIIFCLVLHPLNSGAQEVKAWLDTTSIKIGEQVKMHLDIPIEKNSVLGLPILPDTISSHVEVISTDSGRSEDRKTLKRIYTITSFDSGRHDLPPIPVVYTRNGKSDTIFSNRLTLEVYSPPVDTTKSIKDIKNPLNTPLTLKEALPYILTAGGALLIIALIVFMIIRYKKQKPVFSRPEKILPPHEIAFAELDKLKNEKLWQSGNIKEYYVRLSDIIRIYLENRYGFDAMEFVTDEIMKEFKKVNSESEVTEMLWEILQTADMVKFAKGNPTPAENQSNMDNAYLLVEKTKLVEIVSVEELEKNAAEADKKNKD